VRTHQRRWFIGGQLLVRLRSHSICLVCSGDWIELVPASPHQDSGEAEVRAKILIIPGFIFSYG
jgi:hypothetical protein